MLFNLLLASIATLLCFFFLFLIVFKNIFTNTVVIKNLKIVIKRLQLALIIRVGALKTVANNAVERVPVATDKTINDLSKYSREAIYLLRFFLVSSLSLISAIK